jgi:hypothetical protein
MTSGDQPIEGCARLDIHRHTLRPGQSHDFSELSIRPQHEQALERTDTGAKDLAHGMEAVNYLRSVIVSIDWYHLAGPQS